MRSRLRVFLGAVLIGAALLIHGAAGVSAKQIAPPFAGPVPASYFPAGSHSDYHGHVGAIGYDCNWALNCQLQAPSLHSTDAASLKRTGGWMQIVVQTTKLTVTSEKKSHTVEQILGFAFAVSTFRGAGSNADAYNDFVQGQANAGLVADASVTGLLPATATGEATFGALTEKPDVYSAAAFYMGATVDVEAIALCQHCTDAQVATVHDDLAAAVAYLGTQE